MLTIIGCMLFFWVACSASVYPACRNTYGWSKKKSVLASTAFPVIYVMNKVRDMKTLYRNDWKSPPKSNPRRHEGGLM